MPTANNMLNSSLAALKEVSAEPKMWDVALPLISNAFGAIGAACFTFNDQTNGVEWASFSGAAAEFKENYVEQYASLDLYLKLLARCASDKWLTIRNSLSAEVLNHSEWYQDFVKPCGVSDVIGSQILRVGSQRIYFGLHFERNQTPPSAQRSDFRSLRRELGLAARAGHAQREMRVRASLGGWIVDHQRVAVIVTHGNARVIEMNAWADKLVSTGRALTIKNGRLIASDSVEAARLAELISVAAEAKPPLDVESRMLVGGSQPGHGLLVTVASLSSLELDGRSTVVVRLIGLSVERSAADDFAQLFNLSPAEARLADGVVEGKTLLDMTSEFGVAVATLRAQLRSIFKKCGVKRQVDLVRLALIMKQQG